MCSGVRVQEMISFVLEPQLRRRSSNTDIWPSDGVPFHLLRLEYSASYNHASLADTRPKYKQELTRLGDVGDMGDSIVWLDQWVWIRFIILGTSTDTNLM
jgi:hypothetical protein